MSETSGSIFLEGSTTRRRWLVSAAIVLLVHACIAAAVLTWRHVSSAPPVLVDLTPSPSASEHAALTAPAKPTAAANTLSKPDAEMAARDETAARPAPADVPRSGAADENGSTAAGDTMRGGEGISQAPEERDFNRQAAAYPAERKSTILAPAAGNPASHGFATEGSTYHSPMASMPLDTSITVQPPVHGNGIGALNRGDVGLLASRERGPEAVPFDERPTSIFRSAKPFGVPNVPRNILLPNGNAALRSNNPGLPGVGRTNPPGAHVQDRARAAIARAMGRSESVRNAVGSAVSSIAVANGALPGDSDLPRGAVYGIGRATTIASRGDVGVTRNAVGVTANFRPLIPRAGSVKADAVAGAEYRVSTAPVISGHDLARPISGSAVIGGPARRSGVLSGSDFRVRHP